MKYKACFDLHSNNCVLAIIDEKGNKVYKKRLPNSITAIKETLKPFKQKTDGIVIESTFNWYWLADSLEEEGYRVHLANTSAIKQYDGLKYTNDYDDAFHLANLLRLKILPEGYIYPKEERSVRDLLRKRMALVRQRTANILSLQNLWNRSTGQKISCNAIKTMCSNSLKNIFKTEHVVHSAQTTLYVIKYLTLRIKETEKKVLQSIKLKEEFNKLLTLPGVGNILALTIALETGDIKRFQEVGNYSSYCRCVQSIRFSNEKKKGENNRKNGNKFLAWAFIEAANHAISHYPEVKRFYQRKLASTNKIVAIKATAHKLARAAYFVMKNKVEFSMEKAFGPVKIKVAAANQSKGVGH